MAYDTDDVARPEFYADSDSEDDFFEKETSEARATVGDCGDGGV